MTELLFPLTTRPNAQRAKALERFIIIRTALEDGISQAQVASASKKAPSRIRLWIKRYQEMGLSGLVNDVSYANKGKSRKLEGTAIQLIEGQVLQTRPRLMVAIRRQITSIAQPQGWPPPSYDRVRHIIKHLVLILVTLVSQGAATYREEFDFLYRQQSFHANAITNRLLHSCG
ncbi:hypothetical protein KSF_075700 [Reticulibacter mediterranei]|uniref:Uncharacterized protein n=1 Tax=Reticulibacter mediterranei TaxID=2778369 RepID=A0A8J3N3X3_9CHLR|nr:helix-turn-helix domain-containing protein [Reticulibacter mediterranei]GHO97522.1 hypothetical protein KSF_075700 [Reticulibacter mediterranei]